MDDSASRSCEQILRFCCRSGKFGDVKWVNASRKSQQKLTKHQSISVTTTMNEFNKIQINQVFINENRIKNKRMHSKKQSGSRPKIDQSFSCSLHFSINSICSKYPNMKSLPRTKYKYSIEQKNWSSNKRSIEGTNFKSRGRPMWSGTFSLPVNKKSI